MTQSRLGGQSRFAGSEGGSTIGWRWAPVSGVELASLRTPKIDFAELPSWNELLEQHLAMDLMRDGLRRLVVVVDEAEKGLSQPV
jgi:hypothetical protein